MEFNVGDKAVVPGMGVGIITGVEEIDPGNGVSSQYYVIKILNDGSIMMVPIHGLDENNIRRVLTTENLDQVYSVLKDRELPVGKETWNRRYREYTTKIQTGDPLEVASVLRDLAILRSEKSLSFGERKMYDQAYGLIVQELAVAQDLGEEKVKTFLDKLFKDADAAAAKKGKKSKAASKATAEE